MKACSWDNVIDFKWHRSTKSPNWSILANDKYILEKDLPENNSNMNLNLTPSWCVATKIVQEEVKVIQQSSPLYNSHNDVDEDEI